MKLVEQLVSKIVARLKGLRSMGSETYPHSSLKFRLLFLCIDHLLQLLVGRSTFKTIPKPSSILIVNGAHLGDVLISTSILPLLRAIFPDVQIGFLVGSWSVAALKDNHLVSRVHVVDHYRLNRSNKPLLQKIRQYLSTGRIALRELRHHRYDAAINLYAKPNVIPLLWLALIPVRIGYVNGGLGPLLTHRFLWKETDDHISAYHASLLTALDSRFAVHLVLNYVIPPPTEEEMDSVRRILGEKVSDGARYTVVHVGTGEEKREWPRERWRELAIKLSRQGETLVFTGHGKRETEIISWVTEGLTNYLDLCGRLDWRQFISVISGASLVYCIESVASHVSSGLGIPCIAVWSGLNKPNYFKPLGRFTKTVTANVECIGCLHGCAEMRCVREVRVDDVSSIRITDLC